MSYAPLARIAGIVSAAFGISVEQLQAPSRRHEVFLARWALFHLAAKYEKVPAGKIAFWMSCTRPAVNHALRSIKADLATNRKFAAKVNKAIKLWEEQNRVVQSAHV